jgi:LruC domain-containing protein
MKKVLLIILPVMFLFSCSTEGIIGPKNPDDGSTGTSSVFDFKTTDQVAVDLLFSDASGTPFKNMLVEIYNGNPYKGGSLVYKSATDEHGQLLAQLELPLALDEVVISPKQIGLKDNVRVPIVNGKIDYLTAGYDVDTDYYEQKFDATGNPTGRLSSSSGPVISYLSGYDANGYPNNLELIRDVITTSILENINNSLPEGKPVPTWHPRYLDDTKEINVNIVETADVWMTFVHEGAGWRNGLGFYTFPTGSDPTSIDDIDTLHVLFPNASLAGSGGSIIPGDKVKLGRFEPGTSIGFVLFANAWTGTEVGDGYYKIFSSKNLNPETDPLNRQHHVLLHDDENDLFLIGLEDINREQSGCDEDFNDAVFYISSNPVTAISTEGVAEIDEGTDTDGDGVSDQFDDEPNDPTIGYRFSYPSDVTYGSLAFEDLWPQFGDYDFNDLVMDYQYNFAVDPRNKVTTMEAQFIVQAIGAGMHNGFGIEMGCSPSAISSITGTESYRSFVSYNANGTEAGQSKAVIIVSDDVYEGFSKKGGFINTDQSMKYYTPDTINITVTFDGETSYNQLGSAPFNPFIIVDGDRGHEIHLPSYAPTDLMDMSLFNTYDDGSDIEAGRYYVSDGNLPWGMNLPVQFAYPSEKNHVSTGHLKFGAWVNSQGFSFMDWYLPSVGYRDNTYLYQK